MNSLIILRVFLCIYRILGITFGGITIDNNSKPLVNKWFKFYGYLIILLHIGFDIKFIINLSEYNVDEFKAVLPHLSDNTRTFMLFLMYFSLVIKVIFKECAVIYLNVRSGLVIRILVKNLKYDRNRLTNVKLFIIIMFWLVVSMIHVILVLLSIADYTSYGYLHCFLSLSLVLITTHYCWIITFSVCIFSIIYNDRLGKVIWNLKHFDKFEISAISSGQIANKTEAIKLIKLEYVDIRKDVSSVDSCLSFMIIFRILLSIHFLMMNAYNISLISIEPNMKAFLKVNAFSTISSIAELVVMCFICGSIQSNSSEVNSVLDDLNPNVLSVIECNQWLVLKNVCNNSEFGFTIGRFANLEKTTLIPV